MLTGLAIRNFKSLEQVPPGESDLLPFGPLNVLIGPNSSGKSSLLQAIDFLKAFFRSSVEVYLQERGWDYPDLPNRRHSTRLLSWRVRAELPADEHGLGAGRYDYYITLQPRRYVGIGEERLTWTPAGENQPAEDLLHRTGRSCSFLDRKQGRREVEIVNLPASFLSTLDPVADRPSFPEGLRFREWVERFQLFSIWDPKVLRLPASTFPHRGARLGASGEELAAVLADLEAAHPDRFQQLVRRMHSLFPTFTGLRLQPTNGALPAVSQDEGSISFNSQQMSDGFLRLLAVTSLLYIDQPPTVVMFEEPENGVHPQLLREVVQVLRELTQRKPPNRSQVFLTTHSPYVVDEFLDHPEQVYCLERSRPGEGATVTRLSDRPQLARVRDGFGGSLGEAWVSGLLGSTAGN